MPTATLTTGIDCCYEQHGDPADPTIVLVHGLGSQLLAWPPGFCDLLVGEGFHVLRFDNRDSGLSTCLPDGTAYTLSDMAADAVALLDHLGTADAHFVGMSLGGMIVQTVAAPTGAAAWCRWHPTPATATSVAPAARSSRR